jgi:hypothetical protein
MSAAFALFDRSRALRNPASVTFDALRRHYVRSGKGEVLPLWRPAAVHADFTRLPARASAPVLDDALEGNTAAEPGAEAEPAPPQTVGSGAEAAPPETALVPGNEGEAAQPMQSTSKKGKVTSLDVITSSTGAVTGFPAIQGGGSLDSPQAFNDTTTTGSCKNIHQMKFTLQGTTSNEVSLLRTVNRTATASGTQQNYNGPDGPSTGTVLRPSGSVIAVADACGYSSKTNATAPFPVSYNADFQLYAFDSIQQGIYAKLVYKVAISKQTFAAQSPTNTITIVSKTIY